MIRLVLVFYVLSPFSTLDKDSFLKANSAKSQKTRPQAIFWIQKIIYFGVLFAFETSEIFTQDESKIVFPRHMKFF